MHIEFTRKCLRKKIDDLIKKNYRGKCLTFFLLFWVCETRENDVPLARMSKRLEMPRKKSLIELANGWEASFSLLWYIFILHITMVIISEVPTAMLLFDPTYPNVSNTWSWIWRYVLVAWLFVCMCLCQKLSNSKHSGALHEFWWVYKRHVRFDNRATFAGNRKLRTKRRTMEICLRPYCLNIHKICIDKP